MFFSLSISPVHPLCPMRTFPVSFLRRATQVDTTHWDNRCPPSAPHSIIRLLGEQFWLIYIDCCGLFNIPSRPEQKIRAFSFIKPAPARLSPSGTTQVFLFLPVLSFRSSTYNCHIPKSQEGIGDLLFVQRITTSHQTLSNASEHACSADVSRHSCASITDTASTQ